ncbi:MAG TPA: helix-turn-helix transcriptional regulator [Chloroflexia bacterium]|nr:helix-turn-helix transcriptional regulator [Chloroflexia bacterium]
MQGKTIGERVRWIRKHKQWSMHELAERIGSTHSYISQLERDQIRPGIDMVTKLADALEVSLDHLVGRAEMGSPTRERNVLSERPADYVTGDADAEGAPSLTPANPLLAQIQADLHDIEAYDPAALEYVARMVQAIKEKAVRDHEEQQRTPGAKAPRPPEA